jgi:tripartite-type tricarboxylate transporter receptor subunit TctC
MKLPRRNFLRLAAGAVALPGLDRVARTQTYPSRPINIIVGYPAGGPTDTIARIVAEYVKTLLGQSVVIENVTGASGSIGAGRVARAAPDGYTLSLGDWSTHVVNGAIYPLQYDLLNDFEPIALLPSWPQLIVTKNAVPAKDVTELLAWLKTNQEIASYGTGGAGSPSQVSGLLLQKLTGLQFQFVPYRGGAPLLQDLIAGHIDLTMAAASTFLPAVSAGKIKAYAVTAKARWVAAPEIPTVDEAGLPGLYISAWRGLWAPKGTPKSVVAKLNAAVAEGLSDPAVRQRLAQMGEEIPPANHQSPEALGVFQKAEIEKWWPIIKEAGIKAE